ncbi:hypothetical protein NW768_000902 [Fusarium equiseti]|uniref:Transcription factor n=1 Tax=Fusarium equiseti TaxID=61235 RepID=A0ABQ8RTS5_FUSEQ|nr:hypothetical protein NW768_000902 [Fusarium equiseti]
MPSRPPSPRVNDTEDQFDHTGELSDLMNNGTETLQDIFGDLVPIMNDEEMPPEFRSSQEMGSSQVAGDQILGSSQPTNPPDPTPESSNPAPGHQGILILPNAPTLYHQPPSGPGSQENSNEDNVLNREAAETPSLGPGAGERVDDVGVLENGDPFDLWTPLRPEQEIENFRLSCPTESQPAATTASSNDDSPKPPPPAPKKKSSAPKERSEPAKRPPRRYQRTGTCSQLRRRLYTIAPRPSGQTAPTATNRPHVPLPSATTPTYVMGTSRPFNVNGHSYGSNRRGAVGPEYQLNNDTINGHVQSNMGYLSMPQNASFVNNNVNSMDHGMLPQGQLQSVQNNSNGQITNNVNIHRPRTPMFDNANSLTGGLIDGPNAFAPYHSVNTSRESGTALGAGPVPSSVDLERARRSAREIGTENFARYDSFSTGGNAAGLYHTSSPNRGPTQRHIDDRILPGRQPTVPMSNNGWPSPMPTPRESPGGNIMGAFPPSSTPNSSPMGSMRRGSYITTPGSSLIPHMSSSPSGPGNLPMREVNGGRGSSSMFPNNLPNANNMDQDDYSCTLYSHRRYRWDN